MSTAFKDHFSHLAAQYASFRPHYPPALFDYLARLSSSRRVAWDCACGSGQASGSLAEHFESVIATDASAQQIAAAPSHPHVIYKVAPAEASGIDEASVDLVAVAQGLHWFNLDAFYHEVDRVLIQGGVLAAWTYGVLKCEDSHVDRLVQAFYQMLDPYWPPERKLVESGYRTLRFPFVEESPPSFEMTERWSLPQLLGYLRSWSAVGRYVGKHGTDPVEALGEQLAEVWEEPNTLQLTTWPLAMRVGRKS